MIRMGGSSFAPVALAFGVLHLPGGDSEMLSIVLTAETVPLVVFLLLFFGVGLLMGLGTLLPRLYRQRREVARYKRDVDRLQRERDPEQRKAAEVEAVAAQLPPP